MQEEGRNFQYLFCYVEAAAVKELGGGIYGGVQRAYGGRRLPRRI